MTQLATNMHVYCLNQMSPLRKLSSGTAFPRNILYQFIVRSAELFSLLSRQVEECRLHGGLSEFHQLILSHCPIFISRKLDVSPLVKPNDVNSWERLIEYRQIHHVIRQFLLAYKCTVRTVCQYEMTECLFHVWRQ